MKRLIAATLVAAIGVSLLTGCGVSNKSHDNTQVGTTENSSDEAKNKEVKMHVWCSKDDVDITTQMIESFKEANKGTDFNIIIEESEDSDARDNILSNVHNGADVFPIADDQITSMVAGGALYEIEDVDAVKKADDESAVEAATIDGKLYGYPLTADNGYFMYYNKNYFSDSDVATLDGMLDIAGANGKYLTMDWSSGWYLYSFFGGTGMDFGINDDGVTNHCNWNTTEGSIKGVDIAQALVNITSSPAFVSEADGDFTTGVADGSVIAGISGVWNAVAVKEAWGSNYGAVKLPTYTCAGQQVQMSSFTGYKMMGVNYYSEHKEWACKLADWLTNEENQTIRFQQRSQGPSNINAAASDEIGKDPAIAAVIDQGQYGNLQRVGNSYWDACTDFANTILNGNPEGKDWQEIMDTLVDKITASVVG